MKPWMFNAGLTAVAAMSMMTFFYIVYGGPHDHYFACGHMHPFRLYRDVRPNTFELRMQ
jgi:hypothetical protein